MRRFFLALREAGVRFSRDGCAFLAQAIAFNALFALFPLVVLALAAASYVFPMPQMPEHRVYGILGELAPGVRAYIEQNVTTYEYGRGISSVVAAAFLIWSGKNLFMALAYALDRALAVPKGRPLVHNIARSLLLLPVIGLITVVAMALPLVLDLTLVVAKIPDFHRIAQVGGYAISLALVFIVTCVLYAFLPNRKLRWHFGIPGAAFAAIVWPLVQFVFVQYTLHVDFTKVYGALSAPLALLLWFYLVGSIFLYGAELCAEWASLRGDTRTEALDDTAQPG